jgi:hypothetical protein
MLVGRDLADHCAFLFNKYGAAAYSAAVKQRSAYLSSSLGVRSRSLSLGDLPENFRIEAVPGELRTGGKTTPYLHGLTPTCSPTDRRDLRIVFGGQCFAEQSAFSAACVP